ncbi:uncharacterized protein LOC103705723 [Phoenix dactylifera]|uniref:Uncharacterized protein LOC103705723 n=1 Tax=Phoenix dactylifera TaxID=42345 RepID=A0A8B7BY32_PHODC|nr:uncharacterized protein LOC103705723 [Phoenix dactylifera]
MSSSSSPPSPSEAKILSPTTDLSSAPPPAPFSGDSGRPNSSARAVAKGGDVEKNGGEGEAGEGGEEEEEEAECGFCLFMKGGGCKDAFIAWEKCMEDAEKTGEDAVDKCFEVTTLLKKCMDAHADYYAPILVAEQAAAAAAAADSTADPDPEK